MCGVYVTTVVVKSLCDNELAVAQDMPLWQRKNFSHRRIYTVAHVYTQGRQ